MSDKPIDNRRLLGTSARTIRLTLTRGLGGAAVTLTVNLLLVPFALVHLGAHVYGAWIALAAILGIASLAEAGVRVEVGRRVAAAHGDGDLEELTYVARQGTTVAALLVLPTASAAIVVAPWLVELVLPGGVIGTDLASLVAALRTVLAVTAASLILNVHFAVLRGVQRSDCESVAQVASVVVNALTSFVALSFGLGLSAMVLGYCLGAVANFAVLWLFTRRLLPDLRLGVCRIPRGAALGFLSLSGLALLSQVGDVIDSQWDKIVLARYVGPDAVTAFHLGTSLVLQAKVVALLPLAPILIAVAELRSVGPRASHEVQRRLMKIGAVASATLAAGAIAFMPAFVALWLGAGHSDAARVGQVFAVAVLLNLMSAPLAMQAFAEGRHVLCAVGSIVNMLVNAVASLVLTLHLGLLGAVYGSVLGNLAGTVIFMFIARRRLHYWIGPPLRAIAIAGAATLGLAKLNIHASHGWGALGAQVVAFAVVISVLGAFAEGLRVRDFVALRKEGG